MSREKLHSDNIPDASALVGGRIKAVRLKERLTQREFAQELGITQGFLSEIEKGIKSPSDTLVMAFIYRYEINEKWFFLGEGEMFGKRKHPLFGPEIVPYEGDLIEVGVFALAGAGHPGDLVDPESIETAVFPKEFLKPGIIPVKIQGESMEPSLYDGAIVGVDQEDLCLVSGKVYAIWLDYEGAVIKRVFVEPNKIIFKSDNPGFPESHLDIENIKDGFVLGRIKWVIQKL